MLTYKVLPVEGGGTGANTVAAAVKALLGSSAVGSSTKSIYYDGATLKACADSIGGGGIVAALLEQNGYVKFANGLILQWGYNNTDYAASVTFPIAFTKSCYAIAIGPHNRVTGNVVAQNITNSKFSLTAPGSGDCAQARWIAIGV